MPFLANFFCSQMIFLNLYTLFMKTEINIFLKFELKHFNSIYLSSKLTSSSPSLRPDYTHG